MTDPQNVPLDKARPGDMVFLKPLVVDAVSPNGFVSVGSTLFPPSVIDHIERPARVLKVGDRVLRKTTHHRATVLAIDGNIAWVKGENDHRWTAPLTDLEPVE